MAERETWRSVGDWGGVGRALSGEGERYFIAIGGRGLVRGGRDMRGVNSCQRLAVGAALYERADESRDCLENDRKGAWVDVQTNRVPDQALPPNRSGESHWPITA